ncbi:head-tail connector protein [Limosilactobacillus fermentum]|uniref:head-tail connector protein n=1 Tax=Limosilactobacillus fermentum TaxID=1613 RepID=UPI003B67012F
MLTQSYIETAKSYVASAITGGSGDQITALIPNTKYNMVVVLLVQFWYMNRDTDMKQTPYQVLSLIQQLRGENW